MLPKRHSALWVLVGTIVAAGLSFLFQGYLSFVLTDSEFGTISTTIVWAVALSLFASAGVQNVMLDFIKGRKDDPDAVVSAFRRLWIAHCALSFLIVTAIALIPGGPTRSAFFLTSFSMALSLFSILGADRQSHDDFRGVSAYLIAPEVAKISAIAIALIFALRGIEDIYLGFAWVFTAIAAGTFACGHRRDKWRAGPSYFTLLRAGFPYAISSMMFMVYYRSALMVLLANGQSEEAGSLAIIYLFMTAILLLPIAYSQRFLLGRWHAIDRNDTETFVKEVKRQLVNVLAFSAPIALIWVLSSSRILKLIYADRYADAQLYSQWFALIFLLRSVSLPLETACSIDALKWAKTMGFAAAAVVTLIGSLVLIPSLGLMGAFWAGLAAEVALALILVLSIARKTVKPVL